jgi:hypothetical protein
MTAETEHDPNPHMAWIVEHGAVTLPLGDPSRITVLSIFHDEHDAASACYAASQEFNARMWPVSLQYRGFPPLSDEIAGRASIAVPPEKPTGWWCANCATTVPGEHVTYDERHDPRFGGCGCEVGASPERVALPEQPTGEEWLTDDEFLSALDSNGIACEPGVALAIKELIDARLRPAAGGGTC